MRLRRQLHRLRPCHTLLPRPYSLVSPLPSPQPPELPVLDEEVRRAVLCPPPRSQTRPLVQLEERVEHLHVQRLALQPLAQRHRSLRQRYHQKRLPSAHALHANREDRIRRNIVRPLHVLCAHNIVPQHPVPPPLVRDVEPSFDSTSRKALQPVSSPQRTRADAGRSALLDLTAAAHQAQARHALCIILFVAFVHCTQRYRPRCLPCVGYALANAGTSKAEEQERELAKVRENEQLRGRIKTLEKGWDVVMKALADQGLSTGTASLPACIRKTINLTNTKRALITISKIVAPSFIAHYHQQTLGEMGPPPFDIVVGLHSLVSRELNTNL
ncbi:hypothetical protein B0H13DRAFT_2334534 [Mycena leptocephala]|nr:hypothetical protein B0H13DRAFT_2334534 [Mycena leptocephala]